MYQELDSIGRRRTPLRAITVVAGLVFVAVLAMALVRTLAAAPSSTQARPHAVRVAAVAADDGIRGLRASGITRAVQRAELSFTTGGRVVERPVDIGTRVEEGQLLAQLDRRANQNALRAAAAQAREVRAHLGQAYRDRRRTAVLSADDAMSRAQLEQATSAVRALRANRAAARTQRDEAARLLDETQLRAPFAGVVSEVFVEPGESVVPGRPVVILSGADGVEVEVEVPESHVRRIEEGSEVRVDLPLAGLANVRGTVQLVGHAAGAVGRQFPVIVRLDPEADVLPGMAAEVIFATRVDTGMAVPVTAVVDPTGQDAAVFVVRDGNARRVPVEVGELLGPRVVVTGALEVGDTVVVGGHAGLVDGEAVAARRVEERSGEAGQGQGGSVPEAPQANGASPATPRAPGGQ